MKIVLDTNFLLYIFTSKIDIFDEIEKNIHFRPDYYVLDKTIIELEKLINKGTFSERKASKLGLEIIKRKHLKIINTEKNLYVDDALVELDPNEYVIATQDSGLKKRLKEKKFKILTIRQKKYIIME